MKKIATFGVFDIIHPGHVEFLEECKALIKDSSLIVVIARDSNLLREKKKPVLGEEERRYIVQSLKSVDKAILGNEGSDKLKIVEDIKPDTIVLGYDQPFDEKQLEKELEKRGMKVQIIRLKKYGNINSSSIKKKMKL